jgi:hypothetical protein
MLGNADDSANAEFISDGISQGTWRQSAAAIWESFFRLPDGTSQRISRRMAAAIWEYKGKWEIQLQDMSVISHVAA